MKRLLICTPSHNLHGGVESIINDLCRHLPSRGWEATLALARGARFNDPERYRRSYPEIPAIAVDGRGGTRPARIDSLIREIERFKPDVVMNARIHDLFPAMVTLKRRNPALRLAATIRVFEEGYLHDLVNYQNIVDLCLTSGRMLAAAAGRFTAIPPERVVSIPGGVHPPLRPAAPRRLPELLRIGYVGRLEEANKRIFDLVPFLEALTRDGVPFRLVVAGTGPEERELRERLAPFAGAGLVEFRGWLSRDELYTEVYPRLDCLVHFARIEGVTIAPREAMAHGVVPVISRFAGLASEGQFLDDVNALTFAVGDPEEAAAQVELLLREPGLLTRLSAAAIGSQSGPYGFDGNMDAWAGALDRCLTLPPRSGVVAVRERADRGRLARLGVPPRLAQRFRDLVGRRPAYGDPGSEWPACNAQLPPGLRAEIRRFAAAFDAGEEETP